MDTHGPNTDPPTSNTAAADERPPLPLGVRLVQAVELQRAAIEDALVRNVLPAVLHAARTLAERPARGVWVLHNDIAAWSQPPAPASPVPTTPPAAPRPGDGH